MGATHRWLQIQSTHCVVLICFASLLAPCGSFTTASNSDDHSKDSDEITRGGAAAANSHTVVKHAASGGPGVMVSSNTTLPEQYARQTRVMGAETKVNARRGLSGIGTVITDFDVSRTSPKGAYTIPPYQMAASSAASTTQQTDQSAATTQQTDQSAATTQQTDQSAATTQQTDQSAARTHPAFMSFRLKTGDCSEDELIEFAGTQGEVIGLLGANATPFVCQWQISVPETRYMIVKLESLMDKCTNAFQFVTSFTLPVDSGVVELLDCAAVKFQPAVFIPFSNVIYFKVIARSPDAGNPTKFRVSFTATTEHLAKKLHVVKTSPTWGYVTQPGYDGRFGYAGFMEARHTVEVPENHTVMVSFERSDFLRHACEDYLLILTISETGAETVKKRYCGFFDVVPDLYDRSITLHFRTDGRGYGTGFKMRFSLHRWPDVPRKLKPGVFDCSGWDYDSFKEHVHCNLDQECQGGEDEGGHCPFSSPACNGSVAVGDKCYAVYSDVDEYDWDVVARRCRKRGAILATMKTQEEWDAISQFFHYGDRQWTSFYIGLTSHNQSMPHYYKQTSRWIDNTANYNVHVPPHVVTLQYTDGACGYVNFTLSNTLPLFTDYCSGNFRIQHFACEYVHNLTHKRTHSDSASLLGEKHLSMEQVAPPFVRCPSGHMTHEFFACHRQSRCRGNLSQSVCLFSSPTTKPEEHTPVGPQPVDPIATFQCVTKKERIPFTLVCDFTKDCTDGGDEDFCVHVQRCSGFRCRNGQCINLTTVCDAYSDCKDGSDETDCNDIDHQFFPEQIKVPPPAIVNFDGGGLVTQVAMNESEPCPETHFRCPGKLNYCMPVYLLCNGAYDCVGREDEVGCDSGVTCPGFYRCWDSAVCVHPDHVCDGWPQCPRHDDELLCNFTCPRHCHCQGLAFLCRQPFPANDFPDLRYLDASGSGMKVEDLAENLYLILANLALCRLTRVSAVQLPNLKTLDLADNLLPVISMDVFLLMRNLKVLRLAGNPLMTMLSGNSSALAVDVESIDVSRTHLVTFDSTALVKFPSVQQLNFSFSRLRTISSKGFRSLTELTRLYLRGSPLREYPSDIFKGLTRLRIIQTSNFRLCCKSNLPETFSETTSVCISPHDEVSSCEDLLRSNAYRSFLWIMSVMSVVGNVGSFIFRCALHNTGSKSGFNIFVTNLCLADLLMGVYLAMVGIADLLYRGQYLLYEKAWTSSEACRVAGVLSLLSSEVSVFIICLITLDRCIVLRFPFSTLRFRRTSAATACALVWIAGLLLAAVPLLPVTSHWEFYGQGGICIPLPITRKSFKGRWYSFGVIIVLNFVFFLLIAAGQVVVYFSVKANLMTTDTTRKSQDMIIARRLVTVVVSDLLCWLPIGLLGLLASAGVPVPGEVNVAMAIFVLPLNSALNPFLYTLNILMEKRSKARKLELLKLLESRVVVAKETTAATERRPREENQPMLTVEDVLQFLGRSLVSKTTTVEEIIASLHIYRHDLKPIVSLNTDTSGD